MVAEVPFPADGTGVLAPPRILVLDDEPMLREWVARSLEEVGYEVVMLTPAFGAVKLLGQAYFDLIVTNSVMPAVNGARLVAPLRRQFPHIPLVHLDDQGHPRPQEFPTDVPTLLKPFTQEALLEQVARQLAL